MERTPMASGVSSGQAERHRWLAKAHEAAIDAGAMVTLPVGVRSVVRDSWTRSLSLQLDPDLLYAAVDLAEDELRDYRASHPLSLVLPTIHRLLIRHTLDTGLIVAVGDQAGRLLWIDGDRTLRRKAEEMLFVEGADWSERAVGTSAPGTALALDRGVQIRGAEHFSRIVHPWSCTAVPVHDPMSGHVLGVIDITGGDEAAAPATLPLIEATVAAVEAELRFRALELRKTPTRRGREYSPAPPGEVHTTPGLHPTTSVLRADVPGETTPQHTAATVVLRVLGRGQGLLETSRLSADVSERHAEILTLLAWHPDGLSAEQLARLLYDRDDASSTLRAEMVRLRRDLDRLEGAVIVDSTPYRLRYPIELDALRVLAFLDRGAHRVALAAYTGRILPHSTAPGIRSVGEDVARRLRDAMLSDGSTETLLAYARTDDGAYDAEVWREVLRKLPPRSPRRAGVVARIELIEAELSGLR